MNREFKDIRDITLTGLGLTGAVFGTALVVTELPAIILAGAGVLIAGGAYKRLNKRGSINCPSECCKEEDTNEPSSQTHTDQGSD